jgi:hypothetical protein
MEFVQITISPCKCCTSLELSLHIHPKQWQHFQSVFSPWLLDKQKTFHAIFFSIFFSNVVKASFFFQGTPTAIIAL